MRLLTLTLLALFCYGIGVLHGMTIWQEILDWVDDLLGYNGASAQRKAQFWRRWLPWCSVLLLSTLPASAQFGGQSVAAGSWEPLAIRTKAGIVAQYALGRDSTVTLNGAGVSQVRDRSWTAGRLENLLLNSETFATTWLRVRLNAFGVDDSGGAGAGSFANTARTTDPLGGNTADFIQEDSTAANTHRIYQSTVTLSSGSYVYSASVKPAGRSWSYLTLIDVATGTKAISCYFDVQNGTTGAQGAVGGTIVNVQISAEADGWYRVSITLTLTTSETWYSYIGIASANNVGAYNGDNTSGLFIWGAQLRRATSSSTYAATTTTVIDASRDLNQSTALNQPLISRADNAGNLLVQSETFATTWSRLRLNAFGTNDVPGAGSGSFANTSRTTDPLGGNTADFIQEDATAGNTHGLYQASIPFSGGSIVYSKSVKPAGRTWVRLHVQDSASEVNTIGCYFDVQNGVVGTAANSGSGANAAGSIAVDANGFYRCTLTGSIASTTAAHAFTRIGEADNDVVFNGDNTSGLYIWGASLRPASWDSTYVATVATPAIAGLAGRKTLYHDGVAYYLKSSAFTLNQPTEVYRLCLPWTWTLNDTAFDGNASGSGKLYQSATTPKIRFNAGTDGTELTPPALGAWRLTSVVFDGDNSRISTNRGDYVVSAAGAGNMGGFTLGANGANTAFWHGQVAGQVLCNKTNEFPESRFLQWGYLKEANAL